MMLISLCIIGGIFGAYAYKKKKLTTKNIIIAMSIIAIVCMFMTSMQDMTMDFSKDYFDTINSDEFKQIKTNFLKK